MQLIHRVLVLLTALVALTAGTITPASANDDDYAWRTDSSGPPTAGASPSASASAGSPTAWRSAA